MSSSGASSTSDGDSQTTGLLISISIGIPILLLCLFLFDLLRKRVPSVFEARRLLSANRQNLDYFSNRVYSPSPPSYRLFGWVGPVLNLELDTIVETHGLDTALYLRYLRSMAVLCFLLCLPCAALLPVYFTASNKDLPDSDDMKTAGIERFSLANVPSDDPWRYWVTLTVDYVVTILVCVFLWFNLSLYSRDRTRYRSKRNPANYAILVQDIPSPNCSEEAVSEYWQNLFPDDVFRTYFIRDGSKLVKYKNKFWNAVTNRERVEWTKEFRPKPEGSSDKQQRCSKFPCAVSSVDKNSVEYWTEQQHHYERKISLNQCANDAAPSKAAIVVLKTRRAAAVASQTLFSCKENEWRVSHAPEPYAVNWNALKIPSNQVQIRSWISIVLVTLLTLFWVIPVTAIMGLANLASLSKIEVAGSMPFSFLESVAGWGAVPLGIVESFLPAVILSVFLGLVPTFLRMIVNISRITSLGAVDNLVRDYYFNFVTVSNFLFVALGATLLSDSVIPKIKDDPSVTVDLLAEAFPKQATFMMNFILLKALIESPLQLLQLARVLIRAYQLKRVAVTPRQRENVDTGNTFFAYARYYGIGQLVLLLGIIYSTIQPFIMPVCVAYFSITYIVCKYNLCYSMYNRYQDGGRMYGGAMYGLWIGLFLHLLTMIGLFGLNKNAAQSALIVIPAFFAIVFVRQCRKSFDRVAEHGAVLNTEIRAEEEGGEESISEGLAEKYTHPGFKPLPDPIENLNGVGDNTGDYRSIREGDTIETSGNVNGDHVDMENHSISPDSTTEWRDTNPPNMTQQDASL